jgi:hypothetical protein
MLCRTSCLYACAEKQLLHVSVDATEEEGKQLRLAPLHVLARYSRRLRYWLQVSIFGETILWGRHSVLKQCTNVELVFA